MVNIILITHGSLGVSLLETAQKICPFNKNNIYTFSVNDKISLDEIHNRLQDIFSKGETIILTDIFGGTSCNIALKESLGKSNINVICGVNLNMLLACLNYQASLPLKDLVKKVLVDGQKAVIDATEKLNK